MDDRLCGWHRRTPCRHPSATLEQAAHQRLLEPNLRIESQSRRGVPSLQRDGREARNGRDARSGGNRASERLH